MRNEAIARKKGPVMDYLLQGAGSTDNFGHDVTAPHEGLANRLTQGLFRGAQGVCFSWSTCMARW
jgi:hypothetical protein